MRDLLSSVVDGSMVLRSSSDALMVSIGKVLVTTHKQGSYTQANSADCYLEGMAMARAWNYLPR